MSRRDWVGPPAAVATAADEEAEEDLLDERRGIFG